VCSSDLKHFTLARDRNPVGGIKMNSQVNSDQAGNAAHYRLARKVFRTIFGKLMTPISDPSTWSFDSLISGGKFEGNRKRGGGHA
jgi:hypothetical protein